MSGVVKTKWNSRQKRERKALREEIQGWLVSKGWVDHKNGYSCYRYHLIILSFNSISEPLEPISEEALSLAWSDVRDSKLLFRCKSEMTVTETV